MNTLRLASLNANAQQQAVDKLNAALKSTASAGLVVQCYCQGVMQQPDFALPATVASQLPPVNEYLAQAKSHANFYLNTLQPNIIKTITDINGYSQQLDAFFPIIDDSFTAWRRGDSLARRDVIDLLTELKRGVEERKGFVVKVYNDLQSFREDLNVDVSNFSSVVTKANSVIGGDTGAIAALDEQLDNIDDQIAGASAGVAISALVIIGGGVVIAVGAIGGFVTAGTSLPLVGVGTAIVVAGAAGITASSVVLANLLKTKSNIIAQRRQLQDDLKFLRTLESNVSLLHKSSQAASTQVGNMVNAWNILDNNMGNVLTNVQDAQSAERAISSWAQFRTAQRNWAEVRKSVDKVEEMMTGVETKTLTDSNGKMEEINAETVKKAA